MISRPSNSGIATCIAASIGDNAAVDSSQAARDVVRHSPCSTGTSSSASAPASHASASPPALAVDATLPPAASTVVTSASAPASRSIGPAPGASPRSDPQYTGSALAPRASIASHSVSTNAVPPLSSCAR